MANNNKQTGCSYYMVSSIPMYYDKPLIPGVSYDLADDEFVKGMYIAWHFIAMRVSKSVKHPSVNFQLGLDKGQFLPLTYKPDELVQFQKNISKHSLRKLHRSSCVVKTKLDAQGVGVNDPIVGWYNSTQHIGLTVADVADLLTGAGSRYGDVGAEPEYYKCFADKPAQSGFTDCYSWANSDHEPLYDIPYFLHYSLRDYLGNTKYVSDNQNLDLNSCNLSSMKKARYFKWVSRKIVGAPMSNLMSSTKKYFKSAEAVKSLRFTCDWLRVNSPEDLDVPALRLVSGVSQSRQQLVP